MTIKRLIRAVSWLLLSVTVCFAAPEKWTEKIAAFVERDAVNPPPANAVLFIGSSSIAMWSSLAEDFPGLPVINRGFGGSELADSVFYADRIALPYRPRAVVLYAGENDIAAGKSPESVAADFVAFERKLHETLPATPIYYLSMKLSPSRAKFRAEMVRANELIAAECAKAKNCRFIDVNAPMLDANGNPRPELFLDDQLHMQPAGYAIWVNVLRPILQP
jgi:lysophospholipase L1-like esterase